MKKTVRGIPTHAAGRPLRRVVRKFPKPEEVEPVVVEPEEVEHVVVEPEKAPAEMVRAHDEEGHFVADDPATPEVDEAWVASVDLDYGEIELEPVVEERVELAIKQAEADLADTMVAVVVDVEPEIEPEIEVQAVPEWKPSMRKQDLLKIALGADLDVSSTSTKTQIVAALQSLE